MVTTSLDVLYLALAAAAIVLTIFIAIMLAYLIFILRDASKVIGDVEELVARVNEVLIKPIKFVTTIMSYIKPYLNKVKKR